LGLWVWASGKGGGWRHQHSGGTEALDWTRAHRESVDRTGRGGGTQALQDWGGVRKKRRSQQTREETQELVLSQNSGRQRQGKRGEPSARQMPLQILTNPWYSFAPPFPALFLSRSLPFPPQSSRWDTAL